MLKNVYEGLNAPPKVYFSKEFFCKMYPTCVSSKLCEFIRKGLPSSCFTKVAVLVWMLASCPHPRPVLKLCANNRRTAARISILRHFWTMMGKNPGITTDFG